MDISEFVDMPFSKQLHCCCLLWLKVNNLPPYPNGKINPKYFSIRSYLWKLPRQDIKNIAIMLDEEKKPVPLGGLYQRAKKYVAGRKSEEERKKVEEITSEKEYSLDIMGFLES